MPSHKPPIYSDIYWRPLTEDVEDLLGRFQQADSVRYEDFSAVWRDMAFSDVFRGKITNHEMTRFCRVALATAYKYFLPPYSYQIQVGGLYLMYAFYHTQLTTNKGKIRIPLKDWHHVEKFLKDSVNSGHYDVVYILQKLIATKAIHYTAMPHYLTYKKKRNGPKEPVCLEFLGKSKRVQELISSEMLEEVANIQSQYEKMKQAVVEKSCHITMAHQDFPARLYQTVLEFHTWQENPPGPGGRPDEHSDDEGKLRENESSRKAQLLASIKDKSYSTYQKVSKARRNRHVETVVTQVDTSGWGTEYKPERRRKRRRPPSLMFRTCQKLGECEDKGGYHPWLLDVSEQDRIALNMALKRSHRWLERPTKTRV